MRKYFNLSLIWGLACLACTSCVKYKDLVYLNDYAVIADTTASQYVSDFSNDALLNYRLNPYDNIFIKINTFDGSTVSFLNDELSDDNNGSGRSGFYSSAALYFNSYTVSDSGYIDLPVLGEILVAGLNTVEVKELLDEKLKDQLKLPSTTVKLANFRVTVLGEVTRPGVQYIFNGKTPITEALGMAGDLTNFGNRKRIKLVRQGREGLETVYLNLTRPELLSSSYYYVMPNDLIYVEPVKAKAFNVNGGTVGVFLSALSVITLVANVIIQSGK